MRRLAIIAVSCIIAAQALAAEFVWLEGETPTTKNMDVAGAGWGNKQFLSQQAWLNVNVDTGKVEAQVPKEGVLLGYDFQAPSAGRYEVWNRIGFEFVRSPF